MSNEPKLALDGFLPYRLSVLANRISAALAALYTAEFALSPAEWRVMAALGPGVALSASDVAARTAMDKVQVSRAVAGLVENGRILRKADAADGRVTRLSLSASGRAVYEAIVPRALALEAQLVDGFDTKDRTALYSLLARLQQRVDTLG